MAKNWATDNPFEMIEVNITDDQSEIEDGFKKTKTKYAYMENQPGNEGHQFKAIITAYSRVKEKSKRKAIIDEYVSRLHKDVDYFISGKNKIEKDDIEFYVKSETERWYFSKALARNEVEKHLKKKGIVIGKEIEKPKMVPMLVSNPAIRTEKDRLVLSWIIPQRNCDEIVIIRKSSSYPKHKEDGTEIFRGLSDEYRDTDIIPGESYYYAIFSIYLGNISRESVKLKELIAAPVSNEKIMKKGCDFLTMAWDVHKNAERSVIIRDVGKAPGITINGNVCRVVKGQKVYEGSENVFTDRGLNVNIEYFYSIISVFPGDKFSSEKFLSGKTYDLPETPTHLDIRESQQGTVILTWDKSSNVDDYRLVRKEKSPPQDEKDGKIIESFADVGNKLNYQDTDIINGIIYFYGLYSRVGSYYSRHCLIKSWIIKKEVKVTETQVSDSSVSVKWIIPEGASGVVVRRSEIKLPENPNDGEWISTNQNKSLQDTNVQNDNVYNYTIFSEYDVKGEKQYSEGVKIKNILPMNKPAVVKNIRYSKDDGNLNIKWDFPDSPEKDSIGKVILAFSTHPVKKSIGDLVHITEVDKIVNSVKIPFFYTSLVDPDPPEELLGFYSVYTMGKSKYTPLFANYSVVYCGSLEVNLLGNIENLRTELLSGNKVKLAWNWPRHCKAIYLARSNIIQPEIIFKNSKGFLEVKDEPSAVVDVVSMNEYNFKKYFIIKRGDGGITYVTLFTSSFSDTYFQRAKTIVTDKEK